MANKNTEKEIDDYVHHYGHTILFLSKPTFSETAFIIL